MGESMSKVYFLDKNENFDNALIGARGQRLSLLLKVGAKLPHGFILSNDVYDDFCKGKDIFIDNEIEMLEKQAEKKLGGKNPLILSISGDCQSGKNGLLACSGVGLNDKIVEALDSDEVWLKYAKLIKFYGENVKGHSHKKYRIPKKLDSKNLAIKFKSVYKKIAKEDFPQDVKMMLREIVKVCFASNLSIRMKLTRKLYGLNESEKCSVVIQEDFLQEAENFCRFENKRSNEKKYEKLEKISKKLEKKLKNGIKIKYFVEKDKIVVKDFSIFKPSKNDYLKMLCQLEKEKILSKEDVVLAVTDKNISSLLHSQFDFLGLSSDKHIAKGLPASPGAACGRICLSGEFAKRVLKSGCGAILVCEDTSPEELSDLKNLNGLLATRGGMTSHASVVARGMGVPCVVGCSDLKIDYEMKEVLIGNQVLKEGVFISIDGESGRVYDKEIKVKPAQITDELNVILDYADQISKLKVLANADNEKDAKVALNFGAKGIGLCRTEHMFFEKDRIRFIREMILANDKEQRKNALAKILPIQKSDFVSLFVVMKNLPVTIRLLDPPLHEFLPKDENSIKELALDMGLSEDSVKAKIESLKEFNPMMGHRGLRLAITFPEIAKMQVEAIISAAIEAESDYGVNVKPEIMIPLTSGEREFEFVKNIVDEKVEEIFAKEGKRLKYKVGSMIELPRACLIADKIAKTAEFFSFGTNDLSQMTYGMSRDDSGRFLEDYYANDIFSQNPFKVIDKNGVGKLIQIACQKGREARNNLKIGVCGEQGGEPNSIEFFDKIGLDYVSCSPFRVPIARLATAQARIKNSKKT